MAGTIALVILGIIGVIFLLGLLATAYGNAWHH